MPQVTIALSVHRPEMTPFIADQMRRHEAIFLEESPDPGFKQMLAGRLAVDDYLAQLDVEYPTFSKNMCNLLQDLKEQGRQIFQVEPFLKILLSIHEFFAPFFRGISLDPEIEVSSRVFQYIFRIFAEGDVALPAQGMGAIPQQLAEKMPDGSIRTDARVAAIHQGRVELTSGETIKGQVVIVATEGPETARLLGDRQIMDSRGELCLYYAAKAAPREQPYLILNGDRTGWINSLTIPSQVAPSYAPPGQALISVVVVGHLSSDDDTIETAVRGQLTAWFGLKARDWRHLRTYRIHHALPAQPPTMPDPTAAVKPIRPVIFVCGEYGSVPGIQWAMYSGRQAAEAAMKELGKDG